MDVVQFQTQPGENVLFDVTHNHRWYAVAWKICSGIAAVVLLTFILFSLLGDLTQSAGLFFLPTWLASFMSKILYLGLVPLAGLTWLAEDVASTYLGEFILTDRRVWVRGSPYAWNTSQAPLEEIASMTWRRDAIFIRRKRSRGVQVHMFREGKLIVKKYQELTRKDRN